jgi:ubiquinone/menaquinone biosynthesis C-methylase UbiE
MLGAMTDVPYTHGHHDSVLRSHRWRTAENSAAYLLGHLRPGMSLLDVGCGPGTITVDLARSVAPGPVIGMDASAEVIAEATANAAGAYGAVEAEAGSLTFEVGNLFDLRFDDGSFDVVHAHQVLQHVGDPLAALIEMRRVCRSGGIVAARDADYPAMRYFPDDPDLDRAFAAYGALTRVNGANWDVGRKLLHLALEAGFTSVLPSASTWCFATPEDRSWWGELWADRFTLSAVAEQLLAHGLATPGDLASFAAAYRRWAAAPDGWFAVLHGEVVCTV